jgi:hypothetical protein
MYPPSALKFVDPEPASQHGSSVIVNIFANPITAGKIDESQSLLFRSAVNPISISHAPGHVTGRGITCHATGNGTATGHPTASPVRARLLEVTTTLNEPALGYRVQLSSLATIENKDNTFDLAWGKDTNRKEMRIYKHYHQSFMPSEQTKAYDTVATQQQNSAAQHAKNVLYYYAKQGCFA